MPKLIFTPEEHQVDHLYIGDFVTLMVDGEPRVGVIIEYKISSDPAIKDVTILTLDGDKNYERVPNLSKSTVKPWYGTIRVERG